MLTLARGYSFCPLLMSMSEAFSVFYTLIELYCTKAVSNQASSLAPDWLLLFQRPRIPASFHESATTFQHPPGGSQSEITFTEEIHDNTWNCALATYLGKRWQGLGRCIRFMGNLGQWAYQAPNHLSGLDPERVKTAQPIWVCSLVEHQRPWAHRHGKCMQCRAHLGQFLCRVGWSLCSVNPWSTCCLGLRQTQCGTSTVSTPHTASSICSQCPSLSTAQLNKWG